MHARRGCLGVLIGLMVTGGNATTMADPSTFHLIMVSEVFTNSDGTLQFVELQAIANFQTNLAPTRVNAKNASGASTNLVFDFTSSFPALDNNETILLATQGVADILGFTPDFIIPSGTISLHNGRIEFGTDLGGVVDAVAYGNYTGSNTGFGLPAAPLPCDGFLSLTRVTFNDLTRNNAADFVVMANSPTKNDGTTGFVGLPNGTAPTLDPIGPKSLNAGSTLNFNVSATDCNGTFPALSAEDVPANATFTANANGTGIFTFSPMASQFGVFNVRFIASDGANADTEVVAISVNGIPVARDTMVTTLEDVAVASQLQAYDPDGGLLTYSILSGPHHGVASGLNSSNGAFNYSPSLNYNGGDTLTFRVTDGQTISGVGTVFFIITPVNDAPVAADVVTTVMVNTPSAIGAMPVTDVDNVSWTVTQTSGPFHGSVSGFSPATGSFTYTPALGYQGPDSIKYVASDGNANSNTATIRITVVTGCNCAFQGDPNGDSALDVLDVVDVVDAAFNGGAIVVDPSCPHVGRSDFNCDCAVDVLDVVAFVDGAFNNGPGPCNPCMLGSQCPR